MSTNRNTKRAKSIKSVESEGKTKQFAVRMRPSVFEAGKQAAQLQNRSLASLMETLLILHLREQDLLPEDIQIDLRQLEIRKTLRAATRASTAR